MVQFLAIYQLEAIAEASENLRNASHAMISFTSAFSSISTLSKSILSKRAFLGQPMQENDEPGFMSTSESATAAHACFLGWRTPKVLLHPIENY